MIYLLAINSRWFLRVTFLLYLWSVFLLRKYLFLRAIVLFNHLNCLNDDNFSFTIFIWFLFVVILIIFDIYLRTYSHLLWLLQIIYWTKEWQDYWLEDNPIEHAKDDHAGPSFPKRLESVQVGKGHHWDSQEGRESSMENTWSHLANRFLDLVVSLLLVCDARF